MTQRTFRAQRTVRPYTYIGRLIPLFALAWAGLACRPVEKGVKAPPPPAPAPAKPVKVAEAPPKEPPKEVKKPEDLGVKIVADALLSTPESITFVADLDFYLVSNINGTPLAKDDNGYLLKVSADGEKLEKFIDGASDKITLNAPKGSVVSGGVIYVTDIDVVRKFDLATGEAKGEIEIKGATFLNDISVNAAGDIYVSDTGLKPDFSSSGTDAIYKIKDGKAKKILSSKKLGGPNGLLAGDDGVWVVTFGTGELSYVTDKGKQTKVQKLPKGKNDGIVKTKDGRVLISSWEGNSVLVGEPGGEFIELITGVETPADIGYDEKRDRLLIPQFSKNTLVLQKLEPKTTPAPAAKEEKPNDKGPGAPAAKEDKAAATQALPAAKAEKPETPAKPKDEKEPVTPATPGSPPAKSDKGPATPAAPATPATPATPASKGEKAPAAPATPAAPASPASAPKEVGKPTPPSAPTPPTPPGAAKKP